MSTIKKVINTILLVLLLVSPALKTQSLPIPDCIEIVEFSCRYSSADTNKVAIPKNKDVTEQIDFFKCLPKLGHLSMGHHLVDSITDGKKRSEVIALNPLKNLINTVVKVNVNVDGRQEKFTGHLIRNDLVLTCLHGVKTLNESGESKIADSIFVTPYSLLPKNQIKAPSIQVGHVYYLNKAGLFGEDFAILKLRSNVPFEVSKIQLGTNASILSRKDLYKLSYPAKGIDPINGWHFTSQNLFFSIYQAAEKENNMLFLTGNRSYPGESGSGLFARSKDDRWIYLGLLSISHRSGHSVFHNKVRALTDWVLSNR